jgi:cysteine desulfurase / selenocysteine lyase
MQEPLNVQQVREDFPLLSRILAGREVVYFDNAATSLKPRRVIEAVVDYMSRCSANVHRGKHQLSEDASELFEASRDRLARFFNVMSTELVFVRGATEAINTVAHGLRLRPDENVVGTILEHHSNILPWQKHARFRAAPLAPSGLPDIEAAAALIDDKTRLLAVTHCSNVTGVVVPVRDWAELAHAHGLPILVDGAQSTVHGRVDLRELDCDFFAMSGHKMCGPTGIGLLYGKPEWLERLDPVFIGGGTVAVVNADFTFTPRDIPWRLEAGTPDIAAVIGLGAAVDYLEEVGLDAIAERDRALRAALVRRLEDVPSLVLHRPAAGVPGISLVSFSEARRIWDTKRFSEVLSDSFGIMVRGGHHCAHPLHESLGVDGSVRISLNFYNTEEEIAHLVHALDVMIRKRD